MQLWSWVYRSLGTVMTPPLLATETILDPLITWPGVSRNTHVVALYYDQCNSSRNRFLFANTKHHHTGDHFASRVFANFYFANTPTIRVGF